MKREYVRPMVEFIDFQSKDAIMVDVDENIPGVGGGAGSGLWGEEE